MRTRNCSKNTWLKKDNPVKQFSSLLLLEGEWDCPLSWQLGRHLVYIATFGSVTYFPSLLEWLELYQSVQVVFDAEDSREQARKRFSVIARLKHLIPPAKILCDYWRGGGDLRRWESDDSWTASNCSIIILLFRWF
jgi:hypothetical protein